MLAATASRATDGHGDSYWGPIPPRADSVETSFGNIKTPAWQFVVDAPYHIASVPLRATMYGLGTTVIYVDESGWVYRIMRILGPREIPYGAVLNVQAGDLVGLGGGLTIVHDEFFGPANRFRLGFKSSIKGHHRVILGTIFGIGKPNTVQFGAGYRMTPNARFHGIGPGSKTKDNVEAYFRQELSWVGISYTRRLFGDFAVEGDARFTTIGTRGPREEDTPRLEDAYASPNGYGERSDGLSTGIGLNLDSTDDTGRPSSGTLARLHLAYFTSTSDLPKDEDFVTYRAEWQQFLPLGWWPQRTLALRLFSSWIDPVGDKGTGDMVFQRLMTNDDPDLLRGYKDFRWRDRGLVAFTAEYRWPVWANEEAKGIGVDAYLLTDAGQVFGNRHEITSENMTVSFGGGLRLIGWHGFVGRVEFAASEDDQVFRLRADQVFQFQKGGLFNGRNPVPSR